MSAPLSPSDREEIKSFVTEVVSATIKAAAPHIIEIIASTRPGVRYSRVGDQCVIEPVDPFAGLELTTGTLTAGEEFQPVGVRDYRKQLWIEIFTSVYDDRPDPAAAEEKANDALSRFTQAFPS